MSYGAVHGELASISKNASCQQQGRPEGDQGVFRIRSTTFPHPVVELVEYLGSLAFVLVGETRNYTDWRNWRNGVESVWYLDQ